MLEHKFKISGKERKALKKDLSSLRSFYKSFWYFHTLEKDMASFYGGKENYPMSDEEAEKRFNKLKFDIINIEKSLKELI